MTTITKRLLLTGVLFFIFAGSNVFAQVEGATWGSVDNGVNIQFLGEYQNGVFDEGAAEISAFDVVSGRLFVTNANANRIDILDLSDPSNPVLFGSITLNLTGGGVNSVAVYDGLVAVAVEAAVKQDPGVVEFYDTDGNLLNSVTAGALPDMVTFTPDGQKVLVANEGEPSDDYTVDPEGSVTIIDISGGAASATAVTANFNAFDADSASLIAEGVRIYGPGASVSQDLEPEYIAVTPSGATAIVALQENNAFGILDLTTNTFTDVKALGFKDHSLAGNELDASNRDDAINIRNWPVLGMYQPDAIATIDMGPGQVYIISANEGDSRDYDGYSEEVRVKDLTLDTSIFNEADISTDEKLGRIKTTTALADTNASGEYETIYTYGARSFSIWDTTGTLIWDSGAEFEEILATILPDDFNSTNDENGSFDGRSDDKGPEPEAVTVAQMYGKTYAFIALERVGGFMVYDISNPAAPTFVNYTNSRNFDVTFDENNADAATLEAVVEAGPENVTWVPQGASPNGRNLAIVSNEVNGAVTVYSVAPQVDAAPLFFSEAAEGSSFNKFLEIYNPTDQTVDLSNYAYPSVGNSPSVPGEFEFWNTFASGATIAPKSTYVIADSRADSIILANADELHDFLSNGDDSRGLVFGTEDNFVILDLIGDLRADPGSGWAVGDTANGTKDHTIERKPWVTRGNPAPQGSFGTSDDDSEWSVLPSDTWTGIGQHNFGGSFTPTILHNNDGESQLVNLGGDLEDFGGVARFKTRVDTVTASNEAAGRSVVFLSSGDNFLPSPEFTVGENDGVFYDAVAIKALGYDALALGNHDFDLTPDVTEDFVTEVTDGNNTVFLSSNLDFSAEAGLSALETAGKIASSTIIEVDGDSVGVVGATTPNLPFISSPRDVVVDQDVAAAVQDEIDALEAAGVNKIVLISHLQGIEEDIALASELTGLDVMIAGGGDELLANIDDALIPGDEEEVYGGYPIIAEDASGIEVPIVTTRGNYSYLGELIVEFDGDGNLIEVLDGSGPIRVAGGMQVDAVAENADLKTNVVDPVVAGLAALETNTLATSEVGLDAVRNNIRSRETNQGNLITDSYIWQANKLASTFGAPNVDVAVANGGGIRNDNVIPAGPISELTTFDMLPFGNVLTIVEGITPQQFKDIMENAVSRIIRGENNEPVRSGGGTGRFAQIAGFSLVYNPDGDSLTFDETTGAIVNPGNRVVSITLDNGTEIVSNGQVVAGAPTVVMATADFTARGGDQYPFNESNDLTLLGVTYQATLANYLTAPASEGGLEGTVTAAQYPVGGEGRIQFGETTSNEEDLFSEVPVEFGLKQNFPNPFNPSTNITFDLPESSKVTLRVFNMLGQQVATLVDGQRSAGTYTVSFDASNLASGVYIYRIEAGSFNSTKKMLLIK